MLSPLLWYWLRALAVVHPDAQWGLACKEHLGPHLESWKPAKPYTCMDLALHPIFPCGTAWDFCVNGI